MKRRLHTLPVFLTVMLVVFTAVTPVLAGGFTLLPATLSGQGAPGASGQFDGYIVTNATATPLHVTLQPVADPNSSRLTAGAEWFSFMPASFDLAPGTEQKIMVAVSIPSDAEPGEYETLVQARAERTGQEGVGLNIALNARLKLTVLPPLPLAPIGGMPLPPPEPVVLTDIAGHWAQAAIEKMVELGVVQGLPDGTFAPDTAVSRAAFAKMLVLSLGLEPATSDTLLFTDVPPWAEPYVGTAVEAGLFSNSGNAFRPDDFMTRQEVAVVLARAIKMDTEPSTPLDYKDASQIAPWARPSVTAVTRADLMSGLPDGTFGPEKFTTRAEACVLLQRLRDYNARHADVPG